MTEPRVASLHYARGDAINQYAGLEHALCELFAWAGGMQEEVARQIFFRLNNARTRRVIVDKLIRHKEGDAHRTFFNSFLKFVGELDERRNSLVHWTIVSDPDASDEAYLTSTADLVLINPIQWGGWDADSIKWTAEDMEKFGAKCVFALELIMFFLLLEKDQIQVAETRETWLQIFQQPVVYPPPDNHPLRPI